MRQSILFISLMLMCTWLYSQNKVGVLVETSFNQVGLRPSVGLNLNRNKQNHQLFVGFDKILAVSDRRNVNICYAYNYIFENNLVLEGGLGYRRGLFWTSAQSQQVGGLIISCKGKQTFEGFLGVQYAIKFKKHDKIQLLPGIRLSTIHGQAGTEDIGGGLLQVRCDKINRGYVPQIGVKCIYHIIK